MVAADESKYQMANGNVMRGLKNPFVPVSDYDYPIDPEGLRYILNYLYDHFHKPLFCGRKRNWRKGAACYPAGWHPHGGG